MARRNSAVLAGAFIVGIIILLGIFFTGYRMVQTRQHFARVQSELQSTKQAADRANAQLEDVQTKLKQSISESEQLKNKLDTAQSQLEEKQSRLKAMEGELESAKQAADQAQADAAKLETTTAQLDELQTKLDQANSEIERLKSELQQTRAPQSQSGNAPPQLGHLGGNEFIAGPVSYTTDRIHLDFKVAAQAIPVRRL